MSDAIKLLDDHNFQSGIHVGVTLVDFYANWCGPCRMITPIMEELAKEYTGRASIAKIDVDQSQDVASKLNVTSIPTVILFLDGEEVKRVIGVRDKATYATLLNAAL
jgi:thioredoxin 1